MRRIVLAGLCLLAVAATAAADQSRGWYYRRPFAVSERPALGLNLGLASNGNKDNGGGGAPEVGIVFETPVRFGAFVRVDASRSAWTSHRDIAGLVIPSDRITLTTARLSLVSVQHWSEGSAGYAGLGFGGYRYGYDRAPLTRPWRGGISGLAGFEARIGEGPYAFTGEVRMHVANGPVHQPFMDVAMFKGELTAGVKRRF
jgi:hypothetical protein